MNESTNRTGYKWLALALLWVAFFLQQGTRQVFSATLSSIQASLGVTAAQIGLVATVFTFAYGLSVPFAGVAADLLNRKWMVVSGVFVFCLGIFASGFVAALGLLIVTYGLLNGFGQSFYYPSATSIIGQLHKETRATALSILQMGLYTGIVGCSAAAGFLAESGADGWRTADIKAPGATDWLSGSQMTEKILERHVTITAIFELLGVSPETAEDDACLIEHVLSDETYDKIREWYEKNAPKK